MPAISAQLALLTEARRQQAAARGRGETLAAREKTLRTQLAEARTRLGDVAAELTRRHAANEKLAGELAVLLGGRTLGDFQSDLRRHHSQKTLLTRLGVLLQKCVDAAAGERLLVEKEAALAGELPVCREQAERARSEAAVQGKLVEAHQEHLASAKLVAKYEEQRAALPAGEPCPLCGSTDHPYISGPALPLPASLATISARLEQSRTDLKSAEALRREKEQTLTRVTEQHRTITEQRAARQRELDSARADFHTQAAANGIPLTEPADLQAEIAETAEAITRAEQRIEAVQVLGHAQVNAARVLADLRVSAGKLEEAANATMQALAQAGDELSAHAAETAKQDASLTALVVEADGLLAPFAETVPADGKEAALRRRMESRRDEFTRQSQAAEALASSLQGLRHVVTEAESRAQRARQQLEEFPAPDPAQEQDEILAARFAKEWLTVAVARERVGELVSTEAGSRAAANTRRASQDAADAAVEELTAALAASLADAPGLFAGLEDLRAARLEETVADGIEKTFHAIETEESMLRGQRQHMESEVADLRAHGAPDESAITGLEEASAQHKAANEALVVQRTRVEEEIRRDEENRAAQAARGAAIDRAVADLKYWRWLRELIGSADGRKFRRFAQGLSLDVLVRHANRHLARLSDRYRLLRVEGEELNLEIADHYQAGTTRRMASLSGGESFLTSLALALGLSDLAGRNVRIDSLFVDEGFGSLDAVTLDIAVAALESLRTSNKTIGIISHVELLKERISAQIRLEKQPGGVSTITIVG